MAKTLLYKWEHWLRILKECETSGADPLHVWSTFYRTDTPKHAPLTPAQKAFDADHLAALWANASRGKTWSYKNGNGGYR